MQYNLVPFKKKYDNVSLIWSEISPQHFDTPGGLHPNDYADCEQCHGAEKVVRGRGSIPSRPSELQSQASRRAMGLSVD